MFAQNFDLFGNEVRYLSHYMPNQLSILVGCIWEFNCCVQEKSDLGLPENVCYKTFNRCKMVVMGMMPMDDEEENNGSGGGGR